MRVLFRVAAGPSTGFGHLIRARSLARALGIAPVVSIRGSEHTAAVAASHGVVVVSGGVEILDERRPEVLVVDDPSRNDAAAWVVAARMRRLPVATVVDRGLAYVPADLVIDGSIEPHPNPGVFAGPMYAVLDPSIAAARDASPADRAGVLIALGGGSHVHEWGTEIASAIHARMPDVPVRIAGGFARAPQGGGGPVRWIAAPQGLAGELRRAALAVVAGGMTLYEGAALAVPLVGLAVVAPQQAAIAGFARRGAAIDAGLATDPAAAARAAAEVVALLRHRQRAEKLAATAARLVDGRGAFRAADAIRRLAGRPEDEIDAA